MNKSLVSYYCGCKANLNKQLDGQEYGKGENSINNNIDVHYVVTATKEHNTRRHACMIFIVKK